MRERVSGLIGQVRALEQDRRYVASTKANCFFCRFQTLCTRYPQGGAVFPIAGAPMAPTAALQRARCWGSSTKARNAR